jgi:hypothetical protein
MGLDMYLEGEKFLWTDWEHPENNKKEDGFKIRETILELGYWRKHANLHGYIIQTFAGGVDDCERFELSDTDIRTIIDAIKSKELPDTQGFFFGKSYTGDPETDEAIDREAVEIFEKAFQWRTAPEKGVSRSVYYRASW